MIKLAVAIGFLSLNAFLYHEFASDPVFPERKSFDEFPLEIDEWACPELGSMTEDAETRLGVTDYMLCDFTREYPRRLANVYVGYHETQVREEGGGGGTTAIHPPKHCLPGSGWDIIDNRTVPLDVDGLPQSPATAKRMMIAKGNARQLVYYWYQSRGRVVSEDWQKVIYMGVDRAGRSRTDGSLVRFTVPILRDDVDEAEETFRDIAPRILTRLSSYVPE